MNSDPYDSAAWRSFGMLDPDESLLFDEAMRQDPALKIAAREMDSLAAAIAAVSVTPQPPSSEQLDQLHRRLKLQHIGSIRPASRTVGLAGWACAGVLALLLAWNWTGETGKTSETDFGTPPVPSGPVRSAAAPTVPSSETKRLNQEIEALRENLERFQQRDRALFITVPGKAWPVVMVMIPPGSSLDQIPGINRSEAPSPLVTLLGDAMTGAAVSPDSTETETEADDLLAATAVPEPASAFAIPLYDAARDAGTLVIRHLSPASEGYNYNLWVSTSAETRPVFVGSLPENGALESHSFDFSLGSTMILPTGFMLTYDPQGSPAPPTETNTVLQGPPPPAQ